MRDGRRAGSLDRGHHRWRIQNGSRRRNGASRRHGQAGTAILFPLTQETVQSIPLGDPQPLHAGDAAGTRVVGTHRTDVAQAFDAHIGHGIRGGGNAPGEDEVVMRRGEIGRLFARSAVPGQRRHASSTSILRIMYIMSNAADVCDLPRHMPRTHRSITPSPAIDALY